jgi:hypothetical protein
LLCRPSLSLPCALRWQQNVVKTCFSTMSGLTGRGGAHNAVSSARQRRSSKRMSLIEPRPPRNNHARARAKDSRVDSNDSLPIFFFTDSIWGLRDARLKLGPRVAGVTPV